MQTEMTYILCKLCVVLAIISLIGAGANTFSWYVNVEKVCADSKQSEVVSGVHPRDGGRQPLNTRYYLNAVYKVKYEGKPYSGYRVWHDRLYADSLREANIVNLQVNSASCLLVYFPNNNPDSLVLIRPGMVEIWSIAFISLLASISFSMFLRKR